MPRNTVAANATEYRGRVDAPSPFVFHSSVEDANDSLRHHCGVVGISSDTEINIPELLFYGLFSLQHRGQESAGLAYHRYGRIKSYKSVGMVTNALAHYLTAEHPSRVGIGHVRYSTADSSRVISAQPFLLEPTTPAQDPLPRPIPPALSPADRWILSRTQRLIQRATEYLLGYDYAAAKSEAESFLWGELADNYLEMCKTRLYGSTGPAREAACYTVHQVLLALIKLFAPFLPHVTEEIYQGLFAVREGLPSIHIAHWPAPDVSLEDAAMEEIGAVLVGIATDVRRYKSEHSLPLGTELALLQLATNEQALLDALQDAEADLMSVTRARRVQIVRQLDSELEAVSTESSVAVAVSR